MCRNLRVLGITAVAFCALSAIAASNVSAQFEAESYPTTLTPSSNNTQVFTYVAGGVAVECSKVGGDGTLVAPVTFVGFTQTLTGCKSSFGAVHVSMNSCALYVTAAKGSTAIVEHIECTAAGDAIVMTLTDSVGASVCTLHTGPQTPGGTITGKNIGAGTTREVEISSNVTGIVTTRTGGALCGKALSGSGTYSGSMTLTGEISGTATHRGVFMD